MAESGINAVAVINTNSKQVLGQIPGDWYPAAVALSPDGSQLYILNNKGKGAGPNYINGRRYYIGELEHGTLSAVPLSEVNDELSELTRTTMADNEAALRSSVVVPSIPIRHVFLVIRENRTFDEVFGDFLAQMGMPN